MYVLAALGGIKIYFKNTVNILLCKVYDNI